MMDYLETVEETVQEKADRLALREKIRKENEVWENTKKRLAKNKFTIIKDSNGNVIKIIPDKNNK